ncbi:MAG: pyridoxamine 5'-phosphate oxidase [Pseudomonadota bacterium]
MTDLLHDSAPGFDQPIAVLKHCHERIRKQLATLDKLVAHLPAHGNDAQARSAAAAALKYFEHAAHLHHADEEQDLLPMLAGTAVGADAALLAELAPTILADHEQMDVLWTALAQQLRPIAAGGAATLAPDAVAQFAERYLDHMEREESFIAPMAKRLFSPAQMVQMGNAMQARRGILPPAPPAGEAVAALRQEYGQATLDVADVLPSPIAQFTRWFEDALKAEVREPNAMALSTADAAGHPSSRIVLVKQFDARGFTWYTNYASDKARQLAANPHAALLFFWSELERQVRIEGIVERTSDEESEHYFNSRPLKSRLSALASAQSRPIASRSALEQQYESVAQQYGETPPRPEHWGGYRLRPERIEFWQGRRSRFHDRIVYTLQADGSWVLERLQP